MDDQVTLKTRLTGPALTIVATLVYHSLVNFGAPQTVAILFPFVVVAAYMSGLRAGLIAAIWVSGYSAWLLWSNDPWRVPVIALSLVITNLMVGVLKRRSRIAEETRRKAQAVDELNGNITKLREMDIILDGLISRWSQVSDEGRLIEVKTARELNVQLLTVVAGWRELWKERDKMLKEHEKRD